MMITDIKYELDYCYNRLQTLCGSMISRLPSGSYRATIERNAYDFQSFAKVEVWGDNGWLVIQSLPVDEFEIHDYSYVSNDGEWEMAMANSLYVLIDRGASFVEDMND